VDGDRDPAADDDMIELDGETCERIAVVCNCDDGG
jgi:hypothetical protein